MSTIRDALNYARAQVDPELWEAISAEQHVRKIYSKFKLSQEMIDMIIYMRAAAQSRDKYISKWTVVSKINDNGVVFCGFEDCKSIPVEVAVWAPDEDAQKKWGDRAFLLLLCRKHIVKSKEDMELLTRLIEERAKPHWKYTHLDSS